MATSADDRNGREAEIAQRVRQMRDQEVRDFLFDAILRLELAVDRLESLAGPRDIGDSSA